jgi:hypothetical protein
VISTKTTWRAEAKAQADEFVIVTCPSEAVERIPGQHGILCEIALRNRGWYSYSTTARHGAMVRIFVELRQVHGVFRA